MSRSPDRVSQRQQDQATESRGLRVSLEQVSREQVYPILLLQPWTLKSARTLLRPSLRRPQPSKYANIMRQYRHMVLATLPT